MIARSDFEKVMDSVVRENFPTSRLAYAEEKEKVITDLYEGKEGEYLDDGKDAAKRSEAGGDFEFVAEAITVLTVIKVVAQTFVALKKAFEAAGIGQRHPSDAELREELVKRLRPHVGRKQADKISEQIVQSVIKK